ncbi:unnamed protein product [Cylindrotheca closterium]|uniref:Cyclin N-terminal domain-containing protein n=1 Tax=Cylindrotheca closterium TaxID=2856 RepID=A0AAD2GD60_9STRA|nr:unnamed protein product [Cylindrotheca closterium]
MSNSESTSSSASINIRMVTEPLKVYPMEGEATDDTGSSTVTCDQSYECEFECESSIECSPPEASLTETTSPFLADCAPSDSDNALNHAPLAADIVRTMCCQEAKVYHHPTSYYVELEQAKATAKQDSDGNDKPIRKSRRKHLEKMDSWRSSLIQWMYQVVDFSHVNRQTVGVAIYFLDVAISEIIVRAMNRNQKANPRSNCLDDYKVSFQLAAATALQLAIKTHDCKLIKLSDLIKLGRNVFTERDIIAMEVQIIQACSWYLHPPSVDCYLYQYQSLLLEILQQDNANEEDEAQLEDTKTMLCKLIQIITEIVSPQPQYKNYPPSIVSYAIILVAMAFCDPNAISPSQRQRLSRQLSLALCLETQHDDDDNLHAHQQQQQQQQDLLLQVIRQVHASCLQAPQLDCVALLQDMAIVGSSSSDDDDDDNQTVLSCVAMDNEQDHEHHSGAHTTTTTTAGPTTPPTSKGNPYSSILKKNGFKSPTSVVDGSSSQQLVQEEQHS